MEQDSYEPIDTVEKLRKRLRDEAQELRVDADVIPRALRAAWKISDAVTHQQIEDAITVTFRSDRGPFAVLTLCGGMIVACGEVGTQEGMDDLRDLQPSLFEAYEGDVRLTKADNDATGYGVVIAYRMPFRSCPPYYQAGDENWIDRFGVEVGRYIQTRR